MSYKPGPNVVLEGDSGDTTISKEEIANAEAEIKEALLDPNTFFLEEVDGRTELLVFDDDRAKLVVHADLTPTQEENKRLFNEGVPQGTEFRRIGSIPTAWLDIYGFNNHLPYQWYYDKQYMPLIIRILHDSDYRDFRTMPGDYRRKGNH